MADGDEIVEAMDQAGEGQLTYSPDPVSSPVKGVVVGVGGSERHPPSLNVIFKCPTCNSNHMLNAYRGVPSCSGNSMVGHPTVFLEVVRLATPDD